MTPVIIRRLIYMLASLGSCVMLMGCVIPLPPMSPAGTRDDIGDHVPQFIIPGVTTREDVLMHLGEADSFSGDQSELYYMARINRGGIVLFIPAGSGGGYMYYRWLERTLTVEFDTGGLVKNARLQTEACSSHSYGVGVQSGEQTSCVPVDDPAIPGDAPRAVGPEAERHLQDSPSTGSDLTSH
jgi:hypothetical protein